MRRSTALRLLDPSHARALQLADECQHHDDIAAQLGIDPTAVGPFIQVARAKLRALETLDEPAPTNEAVDGREATSGGGSVNPRSRETT